MADVETFKRCGHAKSPENIARRSDGRIQCRTCKRAATKRRSERIKAGGPSKPPRPVPKPKPLPAPKPQFRPSFGHKSNPVREALLARAMEEVITVRCSRCGAHVRRKAKNAIAWYREHEQRCKAR